jgi:uncharacterized membrane protein
MRQRREREKGAFLIILALTLLALLAVIALAIDTSIITTSRAHFRIAAELANLGALKSFGEGLSAGETVSQAMLRAQNAAQTSLGQNFQQGNPGYNFQVDKGSAQNSLSLELYYSSRRQWLPAPDPVVFSRGRGRKLSSGCCIKTS